jgi:uncharacterized protein (TIGR03083 family)
MTPLSPVITAPLFGGLSDELVSVLRSLSPSDWERPTRAGAWRVRDVAAHLLDDDLRKLSFHRDGHPPPRPRVPISGDRDLVRYLDDLNAQWVAVADRLSPGMITTLLAVTGPQVAAFVAGLDPDGRALFPVAWAGEDASTNWMDTAREYTERWHHQAQIREATGRPPLDQPRWLAPVIDVSMRALPHGYRDVAAAEGTLIGFEIDGGSGGEWVLAREAGRWSLRRRSKSDAAFSSRLSLSAETAWRIFFKALAPAESRSRVKVDGDAELARPFLSTLAVMA